MDGSRARQHVAAWRRRRRRRRRRGEKREGGEGGSEEETPRGAGRSRMRSAESESLLSSLQLFSPMIQPGGWFSISFSLSLSLARSLARSRSLALSQQTRTADTAWLLMKTRYSCVHTLGVYYILIYINTYITSKRGV